MTISSSLLQLTGCMSTKKTSCICDKKKVAESDNSSLSYVLNYFTTSLLTEQNITSRANLAIIESYLEILRELRATIATIDNKSNQRLPEQQEVRK